MNLNIITFALRIEKFHFRGWWANVRAELRGRVAITPLVHSQEGPENDHASSCIYFSRV